MTLRYFSFEFLEVRNNQKEYYLVTLLIAINLPGSIKNLTGVN